MTDWMTAKQDHNTWGDPDKDKDYIALKQFLLSTVNVGCTTLEIGSLDGKWTKYLSHCLNICVDVGDAGFIRFKDKYPHIPATFYQTKGDELKGIQDNSVDVVFSFDTFILLTKEQVDSYIKEIKRVLKPRGQVLLMVGYKQVHGVYCNAGLSPTILTRNGVVLYQVKA